MIKALCNCLCSLLLVSVYAIRNLARLLCRLVKPCRPIAFSQTLCLPDMVKYSSRNGIPAFVNSFIRLYASLNVISMIATNLQAYGWIGADKQQTSIGCLFRFF